MEARAPQQVFDILAGALEHPPAERDTFIAQACAGDEAILDEVRALLSHENAARNFLEAPAFAPPNGELAPGDTIGKCTVLRLLGEGGMGEVYLAQDDRLERQVALKLLKRRLDDPDQLPRFRNERRALAGLAHPNIARLYSGEVTPEGRSYLVMEYVEGERLDVFCDRRRLGLPERLALFRKICAAVAYAHQCLVVHRDLKPANILVTAEGEPKLLDFGIAKLLEPDTQSGAGLTVTLLGALTPEYASPEQLKGEPITTASDVFSLGVVLYELLTGQRPFAAAAGTRRPDLLVRAICEEEAPRPSTLRRQLAGDLDNIVAKAMRKDPARRYGSVAQLAEDLRRHGEGMPVTARADTFLYRSGKFVRRHRAGVSLAALAALSLAGGFAATVWEARLAARRFEDVRQLANSILFEIEPKMASVPGATAARALLAKRALEYLDRLSQEASGNRELRRELAASYERVGDVQGNPAGANLGDLKGALESYRKARVLREALVRASPSDAWARHELANNAEQTGTLLWWNNNTPGAMAEYRQAFALSSALLKENPGSPDFRRGFASVEMRLADVDTWNAQNAQALEDLRQALPVLRGLVQEQPGNAQVQLDLGRCLSRIGVAHREAGDDAAALEALQQAEATVGPVTRRDPGNHPALAQYGYELTMELEVYNEQETPEATAKALALAPRLMSAAQALADKDPEDTAAAHNLAVAYYDYGCALLHAGHWAEALDPLQKGLAIDDRLAKQDPDNGEYAHSHGYLHVSLGEARLHLNQLDAAADDATAARQALETVIAKDPDNSQPPRELVGVLMLQGRIEVQRGRPADARSYFAQALAKLEALNARHIKSRSDAKDLAFLHGVLGASGK